MISVQAPLTDSMCFDDLAARADIASLCDAAALYRGDFCGDLAPANDEIWRIVECERERLRATAHALLARLADQDAEAVATAVAESLARRLLTADPVHEGCCRILMRVLARTGRRNEALRVFDATRSALRDELDLEPEPETAALAHRIRAADADATGEQPVRRPGRPEVSVEQAQARVDRLMRASQMFVRGGAQAMRDAREDLDAVLRVEPDSLPALSMLGWAHFYEWISGWSAEPGHSRARAIDAAQRALSVGPGQPDPHQLLAKLALWDRRFDQAIEHGRDAVAVAPEHPQARFHLAAVLSRNGDQDEALHEIRVALQLRPNDYGWYRTVEALALLFKGELDAAHGSVELALASNMRYWTARIVGFIVAHARGDSVRAHALASQTCFPPFGGYSVAEPIGPVRRGRDRRRLSSAFEWYEASTAQAATRPDPVRVLPAAATPPRPRKASIGASRPAAQDHRPVGRS
ncbi:MAG: BTAD domain-containing putative transcriptional regulator [Burkholderiaceae bacterium]